MEYAKPFKTLNEQADLLLERGLIAERDILIERLNDVGYYRLSGYWHIFKKPSGNQFYDGTTLELIWSLYIFDRQFRLTVLDAIERVEVYMRAQLAYWLAKESGPFGYENPDGLPRMNRGAYTRFSLRCHEAFER